MLYFDIIVDLTFLIDRYISTKGRRTLYSFRLRTNVRNVIIEPWTVDHGLY